MRSAIRSPQTAGSGGSSFDSAQVPLRAVGEASLFGAGAGMVRLAFPTATRSEL